MKLPSNYICNLTLYDSLYVALAQIEQCALVTADRMLYKSLSNIPLAKFLLWGEDAS